MRLLMRCLQGITVLTFTLSFSVIVIVLKSAEIRQYSDEKALSQPLVRRHDLGLHNQFGAHVKRIIGGDDLPRPAPWTVAAAKVHYDVEWLDPTENYIVSNWSFSPGQGNLMFIYASLLGIAKSHNATLLIPNNLVVRRSFDLKLNTVVNETVLRDEAWNWDRYKGIQCCKYYDELMHKKFNSSLSRVLGYFQSYKYFDWIRNDVIREFRFIDPIRIRAKKALLAGLRTKNIDFDDPSNVFVGVHARRGLDITWNSRNIAHGHKIAPIRYFHNAMEHFLNKFGSNVIFVMCSDDSYWLRSNFDHRNDTVVVSTGIREVDMCLLTMCNHTIISIGTFGWWVAYLTGGDTVYYRDWPRSGSQLEKQVVKRDYFLPKWIPMGSN